MAGRSLWRVWPLLFIIILAFSYRLVIMADRAAAPNELANWDPLPKGTDQSAYFARFLALQRGDFPPASFYYQPGIVYFLGFAGALLQTSDMAALRLFQAFLAALNCGLMALFTWRATGSRTAGLASGLLLALYPVSAFYDTDFVITSQALVLATLLFGQRLARPPSPAQPVLAAGDWPGCRRRRSHPLRAGRTGVRLCPVAATTS